MKIFNKRVAFVGQAPPKTMPDRPFGRSALYKWLESMDIVFESSNENFGFFALIDYFPGTNKAGGHLAPTDKQIAEARPRLSANLRNFNPDIIVPIGIISIKDALNNKNIKLEEVVGNKFEVDAYNIFGRNLTVIPFPHPSGASTWIYQGQNRILLSKALEILRKDLFNHKINS